MTSGFCFRAQLAIPEQRELFDYWRDCAGSRSMPSRVDLDPTAIRGLLPCLSLVEVGHGFKGAVVRLAGTALRDIYGVEITGKRLGELEWGSKKDYWRGVYRGVVDCCRPLHGFVEGPMVGREHIPMSWMRLPLSDDGENVNKLLCYDCLAALPQYACFEPELKRVANSRWM